jgi:hypothetical protein
MRLPVEISGLQAEEDVKLADHRQPPTLECVKPGFPALN